LAKETYNFKEPTDRSHPICDGRDGVSVSFSVSTSLWVFATLFLALSNFFHSKMMSQYLSVSLHLCVSVSTYPCVTASLRAFVHVSMSLHLSFAVSACPCVCASVRAFVRVSMSQRVYISMSLCLHINASVRQCIC